MKLLCGKVMALCVRKGQAEAVVSWAKVHGARGATVFYSTSYSDSAILRVMGLGDKAMEIVLFHLENCPPFSINDFVTNLKLSGSAVVLSDKEDLMNENKYTLLTAIVNKGFAEDVAMEARKAGAIGGTVVNARGTSTEADTKLLNVTLVPEKDVVYMVCEKTKVEAIIEAIKGIKGLQMVGAGIVFESPVEEFVKLGVKK